MAETDLRTAMLNFYDQHYDSTACHLHSNMDRRVLGDRENQVCRFCGKSRPEVRFRDRAHAIPESLGNRVLFTNYECDTCNKFFGETIENDFGKWSKPYRLFARIRGKNGVPTLKELGWRVEYNDSTGLCIKQNENSLPFVLDEGKKQIRFEFKIEAHRPVAVLKTFVKIGLTLLPVKELPNFSEALAWIREPDHTESCGVENGPVIKTFQPGPPLSDLVAMLLRRKTSATGVPYAFLVIAYGNHMFQVYLPSPKQDRTIYGRAMEIRPVPTLYEADPVLYGAAAVKPADLCGQDIVRDEEAPIVIGFDQIGDEDLELLRKYSRKIL